MKQYKQHPVEKPLFLLCKKNDAQDNPCAKTSSATQALRSSWCAVAREVSLAKKSLAQPPAGAIQIRVPDLEKNLAKALLIAKSRFDKPNMPAL